MLKGGIWLERGVFYLVFRVSVNSFNYYFAIFPEGVFVMVFRMKGNALRW